MINDYLGSARWSETEEREGCSFVFGAGVYRCLWRRMAGEAEEFTKN